VRDHEIRHDAFFGVGSAAMRARRAPKDWPALEALLFAGALLLYVGALPLGLERPTAGLTVAEGCALDGTRGGPPLALLAIRLFAFFPIADLATRAALASAVAAALAVALLGRLAATALAAARTGDPANVPREDVRWAEPGTIHPRRPPPRDPVELVAVLGATAVVALSLGLFRTATSASSAPLTMVLVAAVWIRALKVWQAPDQARPGLSLALMAGLALGTEAVAVPLAVGPALVVILWAARRARWPLAAPLLFLAGASVLLFPLAVGGEVLARLWPARVPGGMVAAAEELGVVGLLLAGGGLLGLVVRAPKLGLVLAAIGALAAWFSGAALAVAAGAAVMPLAVGLWQLAGKLGRARPAAVTALAMLAVLATGMEGGPRWRRDLRLPARLMERALDKAPPRATVDPGSPQMAGLFRYASLLGLGRDVTRRP
jgi:hypothetical protein